MHTVSDHLSCLDVYNLGQNSLCYSDAPTGYQVILSSATIFLQHPVGYAAQRWRRRGGGGADEDIKWL